MSLFSKIKTINKVISLIIFSITFFLFVFIAVFRIIKTETDLKRQKVEMMEQKRVELKNFVDIAYKTIESSYEKAHSKKEIQLRTGNKLEQATDVLLSAVTSYYNLNKASINSETLKRNIINIVKAYKGKNNEYFWINDNTLPFPTMIMHPLSPQLNGKVLKSSKYNCALGIKKNLFQAMAEKCNNNGSGYVDYVWDKPTNDGIKRNQPKLSFVKLFKPYNWIIGTGVYVDDIEIDIKQECIDAISKMKFNNNTGYFWIIDDKKPFPTMVMHATKPKLNGKVLSNPKFNCTLDEKKNLFQEMVNVCDSKNEGFVSYLWDKPTNSGVLPDQPKLSFVKKFNKWHWIIGTGAYLDTINNNILIKEEEMYLNLKVQIFILLLSFLLIYFVLVIYINNIIVKPIKSIQNIILKLSRGIFPETIAVKSSNEIGEITKSANTLINTLTSVKDFAIEVGKGNLQYDFNALSEEDELGTSLMTMRENLVKAQIEEEKRKLEDEQRSWATQGLAKFADILRNNSTNTEEISFSIISNLVKYLDANQGGFYLLNTTEDGEKYFSLEASIAFDRKKYSNKRIEWGVGLIGRCALERETIYMTEIPADYINITSGLGDANPSSLLLIPLNLNDDIFGVIEIASFNKFESYEIEFVEKVGESIASTISSVQINTKTKYLLEQSKFQTEEMKAQEEELRQNLEEMQATQEEMSKSRSIAEAASSNLNNISNPIIAMDMELNVTYINDAGLKFSGVSIEKALQSKCYDLWRNEHCRTSDCRCTMAINSRKEETGKTKIDSSGDEILYIGSPIFNEEGNIVGVIEEIIDFSKIINNLD